MNVSTLPDNRAAAPVRQSEPPHVSFPPDSRLFDLLNIGLCIVVAISFFLPLVRLTRGGTVAHFTGVNLAFASAPNVSGAAQSQSGELGRKMAEDMIKNRLTDPVSALIVVFAFLTLILSALAFRGYLKHTAQRLLPIAAECMFAVAAFLLLAGFSLEREARKDRSGATKVDRTSWFGAEVVASAAVLGLATFRSRSPRVRREAFRPDDLSGTDFSAPNIRTTISDLAAVAVSIVFFVAAYSKILYPGQFVIAIKNYRMVPEWMLNAMALILPWWEVGAAIALAVPRWRRSGAILISGMLVMFISAVSYAALYKGYNIDCGCFGKDSASAGWKTIGLDVALLIGTGLAVLFSHDENAPRRRDS